MALNSDDRLRRIQQITRFVSNNHLLERIESRLNEFNPFRVLQITHYEIRHSTMLGWLMNPQESHLLRDYFLKKVMSEVLCGDVIQQNHQLQVTDMMMNDFSDAEVYREWKNVDLVVVSKKNQLVLFFENKIQAALADHQLETYLRRIKETFPGYHTIPVFLTLQGDEAFHDEYYNLSHVQILDILKLVLEMYEDRINTKIFDFITYYVETLEELTMQDDQLIALCRDIYRHHKDAINAIIKYGMVTTYHFDEAIEELKIDVLRDIIDHVTEPRFAKNDKEHWFIPAQLSAILPTLSNRWRSPYPITYFFERYDNRLRLILEVGPILDGQLRLDLLNKIVDHECGLFSARSSALSNMNGSYTRIRTSAIDITDWDDTEYMKERIIHLLSNEFKFETVNQTLAEIIQNFEQLKGSQEV
ncbi:hypothetical protein BEP19_12925 [Ammoniphilus oxalaticus]|uniref:PD-(D/E)XK nuclease superfamily protein n=1 Tax=Ammoniphilus oxalaticus TaxID=66863 RepID=A0A419SH55_9BACL|nr:PD-(D/E)XK nuclease family protein [Ammoniphilus oxalaticus]RKD23119.1 hypothetical protein BEP19_12925 [Ammoniphilus oxalaticus]